MSIPTERKIEEETRSLDQTSNQQPSEKYSRSELRARKTDRHAFKNQPRTPIVLILDGVEGHYNKGAIFRLCDAFMIEHLHLCHTYLAAGHRRFIKAARGTFKWVPHSEGEETLSVIQRYKEKGYQIMVAEQCERSIEIWQATWTTPLCIVLGGELSGVSAEVLSQADQCIELPTMGMANSLNVSMSAGMLVFAAYQQYIQSLK